MNPLAPKLNARRLRRQDGMALVLVLLVIAVLALLGIAGTRSAQTELQMGQKDVVGRQALSVAEAGINHAYSLISANVASRPNPPSACDTCWGFDSELSSGGTGGALASLGATATLSGQSYRFRSFGGGTADGYYVQAVDNYDETSGADNAATDRDARGYLVSRGRDGNGDQRGAGSHLPARASLRAPLQRLDGNLGDVLHLRSEYWRADDGQPQHGHRHTRGRHVLLQEHHPPEPRRCAGLESREPLPHGRLRSVRRQCRQYHRNREQLEAVRQPRVDLQEQRNAR